MCKDFPARLLLVLALSIHTIASNAMSQEPALVFDGPSTVASGEEIDLFVKGLTLEDIQDPATVLSCYPRGAGIRARGCVDWGMRPFVIFSAKPTGNYLLYVSSRKGYAEIEVTVTGDDSDDEGEEEKEDENPPMPGTRHLRIIYENQDLTVAQAQVIRNPKIREYLQNKGHHWIIRDKTLYQGEDQTPVGKVVAKYLNMATDQGVSLPVLAIADDDLKVLYFGPVPDSVDKVIRLIQDTGG